MPAGVGVADRVVAHIGVPVKVLRVGGVRNNRVRLDEAGEGRVVVQLNDPIPALAGEAVGQGDAP